ncbi:hypothetical protein FPQ18DRAFT_305437 [Pyronema domesticum]|nr:hypothetical protein FPQ18DRAFT_305437 [Pyronema domesticum]
MANNSSQSQENTQPIGGFENDISDAGWTECEAIEQPQNQPPIPTGSQHTYTYPPTSAMVDSGVGISMPENHISSEAQITPYVPLYCPSPKDSKPKESEYAPAVETASWVSGRSQNSRARQPGKCGHCGTFFQALGRHIKEVHWGVKPFYCKIYGCARGARGFSRKHNLKVHLRDVHHAKL